MGEIEYANFYRGFDGKEFIGAFRASTPEEAVKGRAKGGIEYLGTFPISVPDGNVSSTRREEMPEGYEVRFVPIVKGKPDTANALLMADMRYHSITDLINDLKGSTGVVGFQKIYIFKLNPKKVKQTVTAWKIVYSNGSHGYCDNEPAMVPGIKSITKLTVEIEADQ
jgi:hypothetical protein